MREKLIEAGIKNLKEFGYPNVNSANILTGHIYSSFFKSMLEDNLGIRVDIDEAINGLLKELAK